MVVVSCLLCYMACLGAIAAYARTQKNGKIPLYRGCSFIGEYGILGLVQQIEIERSIYYVGFIRDSVCGFCSAYMQGDGLTTTELQV